MKTINMIRARYNVFYVFLVLTLSAPTSQNVQTHSNNSTDVANELFECVWQFYGVHA